MTAIVRELIISMRERLEQIHIGSRYMFCGIHPIHGKFCLIPDNYQTNLNIWLENDRRYRFNESSDTFEYLVDDYPKYKYNYENDIEKNIVVRGSMIRIVTNDITMLHQIVDIACINTQVIILDGGVMDLVFEFMNL